MNFLQNIDLSKILYYLVISIVIFVVLDSIFKINEKFAEIQFNGGDNRQFTYSIKKCNYDDSERVHNFLPPFRCLEDYMQQDIKRRETTIPPYSVEELETHKNCHQKRLDMFKKMMVDKEHKLYKISEKYYNFYNFMQEKLKTFTDEEQKEKVNQFLRSLDKYIGSTIKILMGCSITLVTP